MPDPTFKSKRTITASIANAKPKFVATASTCIGKVDVIQYPPAKKEHRFAVTLTTKKGIKRTYYRSHKQNKQVTLSKRLQLKNKKRKLSLSQTTDEKYELKHAGLAICHIEIVDYGRKPPPTKYNGIGLLVASIIGANARGFEPVSDAQEEEEEEWNFGPFDSWFDEMYDISEVLAGNDNVWESGDSGSDEEEDEEDEDEEDNNGGDDDEGGGSYWDSIWDWLHESH